MLSKLPSLLNLALMESIPLQDVPLRTSREAAGHLPIGDADRDLVLAIECVEMGGLMILVEHGDNDTQEAAELRHVVSYARMSSALVHARPTMGPGEPRR